MSLSSIYLAVINGQRIINILSGVVANFEKEIEQIYLDIAYSHLNSARQCFESVENSKNPEQEFRIGLNHLRDTYNIFISFKKKRVKKSILFWTYYDRFKISDDLRLKIVEIAAAIALGYMHIDENKNAYTWKQRAIQEFEEYNTIFINSSKCKDIDREHKYLNYELYNEDTYSSDRFWKLHDQGYAVHNIHHYGGSKIFITDSGWEYIYDTLKTQKNYLIKSLEKIEDQ